jgi:voltage-gated potassium channel Kch
VVSKLAAAWALMALCVTIHAAGIAWALRWLPSGVSLRHAWPWIRLFIRIAGWIVLLHLVEIVAWALLYVWRGAMPDLPSAIYFSGVTYTTTGYGDLVLPVEWRLVGAVEALTGILMCGWSTGFFVALFSRALGSRTAPVVRQQ